MIYTEGAPSQFRGNCYWPCSGEIPRGRSARLPSTQKWRSLVPWLRLAGSGATNPPVTAGLHGQLMNYEVDVDMDVDVDVDVDMWGLRGLGSWFHAKRARWH